MSRWEIIKELVGLRAKLYSYKVFEGKEEKKCKGVKKHQIRRSHTHPMNFSIVTENAPESTLNSMAEMNLKIKNAPELAFPD